MTDLALAGCTIPLGFGLCGFCGFTILTYAMARLLDLPHLEFSLFGGGVGLLLCGAFGAMLITHAITHQEYIAPRPVINDWHAETIMAIVEQEGRSRVTRFPDWPPPHDNYIAAARILLEDAPLTVEALTGNGKPLSRAQFEHWRDWLIAYGYAEWRNPGARTQGVVLRAKGRALMRGVALPTPAAHMQAPDNGVAHADADVQTER